MNLKKLSVDAVCACLLGLSGVSAGSNGDAPAGDAPPSAPTVPTPEVAVALNDADSDTQGQRGGSLSMPEMLRDSIDYLSDRGFSRNNLESLLVGLGLDEESDSATVIAALERRLFELEAIRRELAGRVPPSFLNDIDPAPSPVIAFDSELGVVQGARAYLSLGFNLDDLEEEFDALGDGSDSAAVVRFIDEVTEVCNLSRDEQTWLAVAMGMWLLPPEWVCDGGRGFQKILHLFEWVL